MYTALFTTCLFVLFEPGLPFHQDNFEFWFIAPLAAIPVALILGFIIHQLSITLLNPFSEYRTFFGERPVLISLRKHLDRTAELDTGDFQKDYERVKETFDKNGLFDALTGLPSDKGPSYSDYLRSQISRRYSYYYARIDAGFFAPLSGLLLSLLICVILILKDVLNSAQLFKLDIFARLIPLEVSILLAIIISVGIVQYCSKLFREIDVLESVLLAENYDSSFVKDIVKEYEAGIRKTVNSTK